MSLDHAILGFLNYGPMSGYDLKKVFDESIHHFWPADQSQIYRTLSSLADRGWARVEMVAQEDKPNRKVYHLTDKGKDELMGWLTRQLPLKEVREATLIQVFFAGDLPDEEILAMLEGHAGKIRATLETYHSLMRDSDKQEHINEPGDERRAFFWWLTLENGIAMLEAALAWVENVIERVKKGEHESWNPSSS
jgi:PadR family transcriptional regulator, regulatory protein AphA